MFKTGLTKDERGTVPEYIYDTILDSYIVESLVGGDQPSHNARYRAHLRKIIKNAKSVRLVVTVPYAGLDANQGHELYHYARLILNMLTEDSCKQID